MQQNDVETVANFYPPAGGGLDFGFQWVGEVLHLRFDELLQVIKVDGFDGGFRFFPGKGYDSIGDSFPDFWVNAKCCGMP